MSDQLHHSTLARLARDDCLARASPFEQVLSSCYVEFTFGLFAAVTAQTLADQNLPDLRLKQLAASRHLFGMLRSDVVGDGKGS
jgi:hypothetical protein